MTANYEYFRSNRDNLASHVKYLWSYWLRKMCLFKCITGLLSGNPLAVNVLTSPKNSWNLQKSTFIVIFHHSEQNWVRESYFQSDLRLYDCLITPWLEPTSFLVVKERIYSYKFKLKYLKKYKSFCSCSEIFGIYMKFRMFKLKNELPRSSISEVIDSERCAYLNA